MGTEVFSAWRGASQKRTSHEARARPASREYERGAHLGIEKDNLEKEGKWPGRPRVKGGCIPMEK